MKETKKKAPAAAVKESAPVRRPGTVQSVEVAVEILDYMADHSGPARVTDLARKLGMTKARVSRHLQTLTGIGLVDRAREGEGYVFGAKLMRLGRAAVLRSSISEVARYHLNRLRDEIDHTAVLATPAQGGAIVVLTATSRSDVALSIRPGTILELPASPAARLVAHYNNPRANSASLRATRDRLKKLGVDYETEARGNGLGGVAAAVFEPDGQVAGVISILLSSALFNPEPEAKLIDALRRCCAAIQADYAPGAAPI